MTQTNLIDTLKLDTNATEKAKVAREPLGDTDFASELSASSLMLSFFEFNSSASFPSALETGAALESLEGDLVYEEKLNERDRQFLRDENLRFTEGVRASQAEKDFLSKDIFNRPAKSQNAFVDDDQESLTTKTAELEEKVRESSEVKTEKEKSSEVKDTPGKASAKASPKTEGKSLKDATVVTLKATQGEVAKQSESTLMKGSTKPLSTQVTPGTTEANKGALPQDSSSQNPVDQIKANAAIALGAEKGGGFSLPKNLLAQVLSAPSVTGNATSVASTDGVSTSSVAKTVPVTRSANFDSYLVRQVSTKIAVIFKNNVSSAKLTLNPPELGKLRVEITIENSKVKAVIATENVLVKEILEANLPLLKQSLQEQGLNVTDLNIIFSDASGDGDKASGNALSKRGTGSKDSDDQEGPVEKLSRPRISDNDSLDIFI